MKVSVLQENLARGLGIVSRAVATRSTLPITTHVLLQTEDSRLRLAATNLEIAISCWIGAKVEEEGAITVPARLLSDFVASLQPDRLDMELAGATRQLQLHSGRVQARLSGQDAEDFPPIPTLAEGTSLELEADQLRTAIERVVFAAATDDARPVLTGIHTSLQGDTLTLAAADGFRLAVQSLRLSSPAAEKLEIIIPARSLRELDRLLADQEEPVTMMVNRQRSQVLFRLKSAEMVSQLLQGTFPNYRQLIPESFSTRAVADVAEFLRVTRTAAIFARDGSGVVRLYVTPGEGATAGSLRLASRSEEVGENEGTIDALVEGPEAHIAFSSRYLTDILGVLGKGRVALEVTSPSSPGVLRPVEPSAGSGQA
ncbi:MAG: DNA polymerase III subunit beta, partial [Chloroflexi bacterium]|nr:DNA polymerase III subunit beta [Chloroflexota bacterium]